MKFKAQKTVRWDQEMAEYYSQEILARLLVGHAYIAPEAEFFRLGGGWSRVEELPASFAVDSDNTFTLPAAVISEDTVFFVDHSRDLQEAQTARETMQAFADYKKTRQDPLFARENVVACVFGRPMIFLRQCAFRVRVDIQSS